MVVNQIGDVKAGILILYDKLEFPLIELPTVIYKIIDKCWGSFSFTFKPFAHLVSSRLFSNHSVK